MVSLGLLGGIALLDEQGAMLIFKTIGMTNPLQIVLKQLEEKYNCKAKGYAIPVKKVDVYQKVIRDGSAEYVQDISIPISQVIPNQIRYMVSPLLSLLGNSPGILTLLQEQRFRSV